MLKFVKVIDVLLRFDREVYLWIGALLYLGFINPSSDTHFSLCILKNLGVKFCPGCGLGHSISYLLHGNLQQSIYCHPLGIIALPILVRRIFILIKQTITIHYSFTI